MITSFTGITLYHEFPKILCEICRFVIFEFIDVIFWKSQMIDNLGSMYDTLKERKV